MVLSQILGIRQISALVKKRFPNNDALVTAGLLHETERKKLEKVPCAVYAESFVPIIWALKILQKYEEAEERTFKADNPRVSLPKSRLFEI